MEVTGYQISFAARNIVSSIAHCIMLIGSLYYSGELAIAISGWRW